MADHRINVRGNHRVAAARLSARSPTAADSSRMVFIGLGATRGTIAILDTTEWSAFRLLLVNTSRHLPLLPVQTTRSLVGRYQEARHILGQNRDLFLRGGTGAPLTSFSDRD